MHDRSIAANVRKSLPSYLLPTTHADPDSGYFALLDSSGRHVQWTKSTYELCILYILSSVLRGMNLFV